MRTQSNSSRRPPKVRRLCGAAVLLAALGLQPLAGHAEIERKRVPGAPGEWRLGTMPTLIKGLTFCFVSTGSGQTTVYLSMIATDVFHLEITRGRRGSRSLSGPGDVSFRIGDRTWRLRGEPGGIVSRQRYRTSSFVLPYGERETREFVDALGGGGALVLLDSAGREVTRLDLAGGRRAIRSLRDCVRKNSRPSELRHRLDPRDRFQRTTDFG